MPWRYQIRDQVILFVQDGRVERNSPPRSAPGRTAFVFSQGRRREVRKESCGAAGGATAGAGRSRRGGGRRERGRGLPAGWVPESWPIAERLKIGRKQFWLVERRFIQTGRHISFRIRPERWKKFPWGVNFTLIFYATYHCGWGVLRSIPDNILVSQFDADPWLTTSAKSLGCRFGRNARSSSADVAEAGQARAAPRSDAK